MTRTLLFVLIAGAVLVAQEERPVDLKSLPEIGEKFRVQPYLRAAARLQGLGRDAACAELLSAKLQDPVIILCRMLFVPKAKSTFRRPWIGAPSFLGGTDIPDWPMEPIEVVDGVPFLVTRGYTLLGFPEPSESYLRYCMENCDWNPVRYRELERGQLQEALAKLLKSSKWKQSFDCCEGDYLSSQIK